MIVADASSHGRLLPGGTVVQSWLRLGVTAKPLLLFENIRGGAACRYVYLVYAYLPGTTILIVDDDDIASTSIHYGYHGRTTRAHRMLQGVAS